MNFKTSLIKLQTLLFLLLSNVTFSQKKEYNFDYLLEYEITYFKDSIKIKDRNFWKNDTVFKKYYFTNSKQNNYLASITELDSLYYKLIFVDIDGLRSNVNISKSDLNNAETLNIECFYINRYNHRFDILTKDYEFFKLNDTIIDGKSLSRYKMESNNPRKTKRKMLGTQYYIFADSTSFHSPLLTHPTAYEEWKKEKSLPNGLFLEKYFVDYYGKLHSKQRLLGYWKIDKKVVIDKDCDYTEKK